MAQIDLDEKVDSLNEKKTLQEEKVKGIAKSMESLKERYSKENAKLTKLNSEIAECEGILFRNELLKHGIKNFKEFRAMLEKQDKESKKTFISNNVNDSSNSNNTADSKKDNDAKKEKETTNEIKGITT